MWFDDVGVAVAIGSRRWRAERLEGDRTAVIGRIGRIERIGRAAGRQEE